MGWTKKGKLKRMSGTFEQRGAVRSLYRGNSMRIAIVLVSFLPFLYYATRDNLFHFRGRRVSLAEHLLHLAIGLALAIVLMQAVFGNLAFMTIGLLFFVMAGGLDEYIWHRGLPEEESDLHAKEHLALLIFIVATLVAHWLERHEWQVPPELLEKISQPGTGRTITH